MSFDSANALSCAFALGLVACSANAPTRGTSDSPLDSADAASEASTLPDTGSGEDPGADTDAAIDLDAGFSDGSANDCGPKLIGIVRDFDDTDPDFEEVPNDGVVPGIVEDALVDGAPALANVVPGIESAATFAEWYSTAHAAERTYEFDLDSGLLDKTMVGGSTVYASEFFFPIDNVPSAQDGFIGSDNVEHNFHFTFELNTRFVYHAGDVFEFEGDDDLWVFIDGELVVDLGGVHFPAEGEIALDTLGLTPEEEYPLSIFHAERHSKGSNFKITTTLEFTNCEPIIR